MLAEILLKGLAPAGTALALLVSIGFYASVYAQSLSEGKITIPRDTFDEKGEPLRQPAGNDNEQLKKFA